MSIDDRISELGLVLPVPPPLGGEYVRAVREGDLLFVSGHGPYRDGGYSYIGKVDTEVSVEEAREAAQLTILNALATVEQALGSLESVQRVVKMLGMVNSAPGFTQHPHVIDAASTLLVDLFGERGRHARSAVGLGSLPLGISVEIELVLAVA